MELNQSELSFIISNLHKKDTLYSNSQFKKASLNDTLKSKNIEKANSSGKLIVPSKQNENATVLDYINTTLPSLQFTGKLLNQRFNHICGGNETRYEPFKEEYSKTINCLSNENKLNSISSLENTNNKYNQTLKMPQLIRERLSILNNDRSNSLNSTSRNNSLILKHLRYLNFRPVICGVEEKLKTPADYGYYYKINCTEFSLIRNTLEDNGFRDFNHPLNLIKVKGDSKESQGLNNNILIYWTGAAIKSDQYRLLNSYQKINHFPRSGEVTRKDYLYRNMQRLAEMHSIKDFSFVPKSFILPNEMKNLEEEMEKDPEVVWIIKPVSSSQGRGIYLTTKITEIKGKTQQIACKYIKNPFLINGFKFDLRVYFLITSLEPLRIYIYKEGLTRFATEKYNISEPLNQTNYRFMHLTNYAVNKENASFIQNEGIHMDGHGSKWSLSALKEELESQGINFESILNNIKDIAIKAFISGEHVMLREWKNQLENKQCCFELFGFDILLDSELNPWLLEINLTPSLHCDSQLDLKIKSSLVADILNIIMVLPLGMVNKEVEHIKRFILSQEAQDALNEISQLECFKSMKFTPYLKYLLWRESEESKRLGDWQKIFPVGDSVKYLKYFEGDKSINLLFCLKETNKEDPKDAKKLKLTYIFPLFNKKLPINKI